ncbi:MAG: ferredoxin family protein [Candidatus Thorarchaeota archaeon]|nr:ferredoxin family protein [Candidatus Thorarchaeota archaeon]
MSNVQRSIVQVDWSLCYGCEKCIIACPVNVFILITTKDGREVVDSAHESDCIFCLLCEIVCPVEAITIARERGSEDTLQSLLHGSD